MMAHLTVAYHQYHEAKGLGHIVTLKLLNGIWVRASFNLLEAIVVSLVMSMTRRRVQLIVSLRGHTLKEV